jgi:hypothetical protein
MATKFSLPLDQDVDKALEHIRSSILNAGGEFSGNTKSGSFSGKTPLGNIAGNYTIEDKEIQVEITKRPMILSKIAIKSKIAEYLT